MCFTSAVFVVGARFKISAESSGSGFSGAGGGGGGGGGAASTRLITCQPNGDFTIPTSPIFKRSDRSLNGSTMGASGATGYTRPSSLLPGSSEYCFISPLKSSEDPGSKDD